MSRNMLKRCPYCEQRHAERHLCDPAKQMLDAVYARGRSFDMPSIEFDEPLEGTTPALGSEPGDMLVRQIVVMAAVVPVAGAARAALLISGVAATGQPLPRWVYVGDDDEIARLDQLVHDMTSMALRRAQEARTNKPLEDTHG